MTRTDWQILNSINEKGFIEKSDLTNLMSPFAGPKSIDNILRKFKGDNLIHEQERKLTLTDKGIELHTACFEKQKIFRQNVMTDISEQDYQVAIFTLQKIIANITKKPV